MPLVASVQDLSKIYSKPGTGQTANPFIPQMPRGGGRGMR